MNKEVYPTTTEYLLTSLDEFSTYYVQVHAETAVSGSASSILSAKTKEDGQCSYRLLLLLLSLLLFIFALVFVHQCLQVAATCSIQITYKYHAILSMFASLRVKAVYCFWLTNVFSTDVVLNVKKCNRPLEPKHEHSQKIMGS